MTRSWQTTMVASMLLALCMAASVLLLRRVDQVRTSATLEEVLYIPSPQVLKRMSLGYEGLLADIYWTRAVQYFGGHHSIGAEHFKLLAPLLDITTQLDPHLTAAYDFGANFLAPPPPNGAGEADAAIRLSKFGIQNNPNEWRLYYNLGFIYYFELKDYAEAADAFARGSQVPNAHPFLKILAARMAERAGDVQTARILWTTTYQNTQNKDIRANAAAHLRALVVDEDVPALEAVADQFRKKTGRFPASFSELEAAGFIRGTPVDPLGHPYKLTPDGRVEVRDPDTLPFIVKGTPPGYVAPKIPKFLPGD